MSIKVFTSFPLIGKSYTCTDIYTFKAIIVKNINLKLIKGFETSITVIKTKEFEDNCLFIKTGTFDTIWMLVSDIDLKKHFINKSNSEFAQILY